MENKEIERLYFEYEMRFGEKPLIMYPMSAYSPVYVELVQKALKEGKPYTEEDLDKALETEHEIIY